MEGVEKGEELRQLLELRMELERSKRRLREFESYIRTLEEELDQEESRRDS